TGLSRDYCDITVIGIGLEQFAGVKDVQLISDLGSTPRRDGEPDISAFKLMRELKGVEEIYTYNCSRFDVPFIHKKLGIDLKTEVVHTDLMYGCWRHNLKGGLKAVEQRLGIKRKLTGIDGRMAVKLWWQYYNENDRQALKTLLKYNEEDVVNLRGLRQKLHIP
ncbi:MAG: ribonuclease H-like domain-containing protein, partial [Sedimentisphaerales bacterium]|nr:ribonuclease H-like domain-containing protein [Sedimentisphaerales bacterium]